MRALIVAYALVAILLPGERTWADADLYRCQIIVTGTDQRERPEGLERCVRQAVVKVTGRPSLLDDPRMAAIARRYADLVEDFVYLDRMTDIPHHDEQGSRDRPYDLIAHIDPARLGQALEAAGLRPWPTRPKLLTAVTVEKGDARFTLTADDDEGERQRQALLAAADRFGLRVVLPTRARPSTEGGGTALIGRLLWSDTDFGWNADWRLEQDGSEQGRWSVRGVSFDEAYRAGVGGAAERLSAH